MSSKTLRMEESELAQQAQALSPLTCSRVIQLRKVHPCRITSKKMDQDIINLAKLSAQTALGRKQKIPTMDTETVKMPSRYRRIIWRLTERVLKSESRTKLCLDDCRLARRLG